MLTKPGLKLRSTVCTTEVVVVRPAAGPVALTCCDAELTSGEVSADVLASTAAHGVLLGKRYADPDSGLELLCTKPGAGELAVDGRPLELKGAKPLPASD